MKLKMSKIVSAVSTIEGMKEKRVPFDLGLLLSANYRGLVGYADDYRDAENALIMEHAEKDDTGKVVVKDGKTKIVDMVAFADARTKLENTEIEVQVTQIPNDLMRSCDKDGFDSLTVGEIDTIGFMITE